MNGIDGLLTNPWVNIGLGLLAANRPGGNAAQAIGEGGLLGLENMRRQQEYAARQQERAQRQQIQNARLQMEQAELEMMQNAPPAPPKTMSMIEGNDKVTYMANPQTGQWQEVARGPRWNPNSGMGLQVGPDGSIMFGTGGALSQMQRTPLNVPIDKAEARKLRAEARGYDKLKRDGEAVLSFIQQNPGAAGAIPKMKKFAGSWTEQVGDFMGSETLKETGREWAGDLALYKMRAQALIDSSKVVLMSNEGRLSNEDRARLESANQALEAATTDREVKLVVNDLLRVAKERKAALGYQDPNVYTNEDLLDAIIEGTPSE